jgi:hypothetical protein
MKVVFLTFWAFVFSMSCLNAQPQVTYRLQDEVLDASPDQSEVLVSRPAKADLMKKMQLG